GSGREGKASRRRPGRGRRRASAEPPITVHNPHPRRATTREIKPNAQQIERVRAGVCLTLQGASRATKEVDSSRLIGSAILAVRAKTRRMSQAAPLAVAHVVRLSWFRASQPQTTCNGSPLTRHV